jgi:predicted O-methyltransferase YrrM
VTLAERMGFEGSSTPEVGRLLATLAAQRPGGRLAEIGTGCGVGAAWIASGMRGRAALVTVELDSKLAAASARLLRDVAGVQVVEGDWVAVLPARGPFDLVFLDGGGSKPRVTEVGPRVVELLSPGGSVVIDDLTAGRAIEGDPVREFWLLHPDLAAVEILTTPAAAAILATRR